MKFALIRHAYAGDASRDPVVERERPLVEEGRATAEAMAAALDALGEYPKAIFASPFARATETADIFGRHFGVQVNVVGGLAPMRPMETEIANLAMGDHLSRVWCVVHVDNSGDAMDSLGGDIVWDPLVMCEYRRVSMSRKDATWEFRTGLKPSQVGRKDRKS